MAVLPKTERKILLVLHGHQGRPTTEVAIESAPVSALAIEIDDGAVLVVGGAGVAGHIIRRRPVVSP